MRLTDVLARIKKFPYHVFSTADIVACLDLNKTHASKILMRLEDAGHLVRIKRGLWTFPEGLDPLALPQHLTAPFPSYVSLQSALYYHGMISQIPAVTYVVSLARTREYATPLGAFSIHHVSPSFFFGYESVGTSGIKMATPEKALLDFFYLRPAKSGLFRALPELELPPGFSPKKARHMLRKVAHPRRKILERAFSAAMNEATKRT